MALTLRDLLAPSVGSRLSRFVEFYAQEHVYMVHVGAGWALARVPVRRTAFFSGLHVLLRWLVVDGYGFHEGYFHWRKWMGRSRRPRWLSSYACRVFDQGFGRSLWFVKGGDVASITAAIRTFSEERHADFWSGVGLACTYAGPRGEHADASGGHPKLRRPFAQVVVDVELGEQLPVNEGPKRAKRRRNQQNAGAEPGGEKKDGAEIARGAAITPRRSPAQMVRRAACSKVMRVMFAEATTTKATNPNGLRTKNKMSSSATTTSPENETKARNASANTGVRNANAASW